MLQPQLERMGARANASFAKCIYIERSQGVPADTRQVLADIAAATRIDIEYA